ncbi:MAG: hypothetical protein H0V16_07075 [Burkholderiaceae bacterium]|nr:hypothetical protein [Burkholderiaceae bacterium]
MLTWTFNHLTSFQPRQRASPSPKALESAKTLRPAEAPATLEENPHLAVRRAQALRSLFPKLSSWFGSRRDALFIGEINEYLSQASNVTDLEQRIRKLEQQQHFN